jgi:hypothetical protein
LAKVRERPCSGGSYRPEDASRGDQPVYAAVKTQVGKAGRPELFAINVQRLKIVRTTWQVSLDKLQRLKSTAY